MLAERADRALADARVARAIRSQRPIEQGGIAGEGSVGSDQRVRRHGLAAAARDIDLPLGDQRGCEIEHDGRGAVARDPGAKRRGRQPAIQPAERRNQYRARGVDEMNRDEPRRRGALRPFADPADVAGIAQRNRRKPHAFRFFDAEVDGDRRHRLAEAEPAVEDADHRRVHDPLDRLIGNDLAYAHGVDVARHADDPMAVMAGEIGVDQRAGHAVRFLRQAAGAGENVGAVALERAGRNVKRHGPQQ